MQSRVSLGPGKFHVVVLVLIKASVNHCRTVNGNCMFVFEIACVPFRRLLRRLYLRSGGTECIVQSKQAIKSTPV